MRWLPILLLLGGCGIKGAPRPPLDAPRQVVTATTTLPGTVRTSTTPFDDG